MNLTIQEKLEKEEFVYSYNTEEKIVTVTSKDHKFIFMIVYSVGNYDTTFKDDNGEYKEGTEPTSKNYDICKNLIEILNTYDTNFATLDWSFASYAIE